jgi:hypothetical protein
VKRCRSIAHIACTRGTKTISMQNKRRDEVVVAEARFRCEQGGERSSRNAQKRNGALKGHGTESIKCRRTESARGVQKTLMQTERAV